MVGVFVLLVQHPVGGDHVVHHVGLADLLRTELLGGGQIPPIVVAQMVVRYDGCRLDAGAYLNEIATQQTARFSREGKGYERSG